MEKFKVFNGSYNKDLEDERNKNQLGELIKINIAWSRIIQATANNFNQKNPSQNDLMKVAFAGVKYITGLSDIKHAYEKMDVEYPEDINSIETTFNLISSIFTVMSGLTPRNFMMNFPVSKEFDGEKWCSKDYFTTMNEINKLDIDKPIGSENLENLLWDYQNDLIRKCYAELLCTASAMRKAQGGKGIMEEWCEEMNIPTYTINKKDGYILNNQTGSISGFKQHGNLKVVK